jgi:hypothetical protein
MRFGSEHRTLLCTALLAIGAPIGAASWISSRTHELADQLGEAGGVPAAIGRVDADLSGAVRLEGVAFGDILHADAVEASVGMGSLLDGQLRADEIRVEGPHVAISVDADGDSDLARLARRLRGHKSRRPGGGSGHQIRRIVVADGTLVTKIAGIGELTADGVELLPDEGGIRVVTGPLRVRGGDDTRDLRFDVVFDRSAAEVSHQMKIGRVLAVGGSGTASAGSGATLAFRDLAAGRRGPHRPFEVLAVVDDNGAPRTASIEAERSRVTIRGDRFPLRAFASLAPTGFDLSDSRATGVITVETKPAGMHVTGAGSFEHLVIADPRLSADPVPLSFAMEAELDLGPDAITVPRVRLRLPPGAAAIPKGESPPLVELALSGWVRRSKPISGQLEVSVPPAPCATLLAALPAPIRGPLDGMAISGTGGGSARLLVDLVAPEGTGVTLTGALEGGCTVTTEPPLADVTSLAKDIDQQLADGSRVHTGPNEPNWTNLKSLPWYVMGAFVSAEDGRFWEHDGFDLEQIARSLEIDLREHRLARGGSTMSQQLVKNAFLSQRRSFDRKLQEAILTWRLEARLDKKQILERYLNIIELGPRIFGLRAAAKYWFNLSPRELNVKQAAFLAALTSQPTSMSKRVRKAGGVDPDTNERVMIILAAMRRDGILDEPTWLDARLQKLWFAPTAVPPDR